MPVGWKEACKHVLSVQLVCYQELLKEIAQFKIYSLPLLNKINFFFQDSDGDKSDDNLVVDVSNEVTMHFIKVSFKQY